MKKSLSIILISICLVMTLVGCEKSQVEEKEETKNSNEIIKIMEEVYVDYINDIYMDKEKYIGKTLELEGMFTKEKDEEGKEHFYVYRWADMTDDSYEEEDHDDQHNHEESEIVEGKCGLEFSYDKTIPNENEWIKVVGKLKENNGDLVIEGESVEIMKDRGLEKVKSFY